MPTCAISPISLTASSPFVRSTPPKTGGRIETPAVYFQGGLGSFFNKKLSHTAAMGLAAVLFFGGLTIKLASNVFFHGSKSKQTEVKTTASKTEKPKQAGTWQAPSETIRKTVEQKFADKYFKTSPGMHRIIHLPARPLDGKTISLIGTYSEQDGKPVLITRIASYRFNGNTLGPIDFSPKPVKIYAMEENLTHNAYNAADGKTTPTIYTVTQAGLKKDGQVKYAPTTIQAKVSP